MSRRRSEALREQRIEQEANAERRHLSIIEAEKRRDTLRASAAKALAKLRKQSKKAGVRLCEHGNCRRPIQRTDPDAVYCQRHHQGFLIVEHTGTPRYVRRRMQLDETSRLRRQVQQANGTRVMPKVAIPAAQNEPTYSRARALKKARATRRGRVWSV